MLKKSKVSKVKAKITFEEIDPITDILFSFLKDKDGNEKTRKVYMSGDKVIKEEIINS